MMEKWHHVFSPRHWHKLHHPARIYCWDTERQVETWYILGPIAYKSTLQVELKEAVSAIDDIQNK